ncbi:MAG: hypothetical protein C4308_00415 [Chitinophagaceae bacterium]
MKSAVVSLIFLLVISCGKEKNQQVLPPQKMKDVLWDLVRADFYVSDFIMHDSLKNKKHESQELYNEVFRIHHITKEQVKSSIIYYQSHPEEFKPILDSLAVKSTEPVRFWIRDSTNMRKSVDTVIQ